jgi:mono/diheme cytochrome c family protein
MRARSFLLAVCGCLAAVQARADATGLYTVRDRIYIDHGTYKGFLYYGDQCERCHGPEGVGGSFAPSLVDSLKRLSREKFETVVMDGRKNLTNTVHNVMPAFRPNPDVVEHLGNIYAYLKARSDGALGRGHPEHLEESGR